jgi:hypothetical protein
MAFFCAYFKELNCYGVSNFAQLVIFCASGPAAFQPGVFPALWKIGFDGIGFTPVVASLCLTGRGKPALKKLSSPASGLRSFHPPHAPEGEHDVGIILALLYDKGPRPGFFLQTKQSQGLSISRTPGDTQQKAWGSALIFRGPFCLELIRK